MKTKTTLLLIIGLAVASLSGFAQDNEAASAAAEDLAAAEGSGEVIPIITITDVPLTVAIDNLARQAGINYMFDPKVLGDVGPDGRPVSQPNVSIRWENITANQALGAILENHDLVLEPDPRTKIARITYKDPAALEPLVTKVIQLKYSSPTNVVALVQPTLGQRSRVMADNRTSQLVVVATELEHEAVDRLIEQIDTPTRQVLIEARLMETLRNPSTIKGIDWTGTLAAQHFSIGNNVNGGQGGRFSHTRDYNTNSAFGGFDIVDNFGPNNTLNSPGLLMDTKNGFSPGTAFLDADGLSAVLSFLNTDNDTETVATPRAVTLDNQLAELSVTRAEPIFKATAGTQGSPGGSEVTYTNLGVILKVTPRISANDYVSLRVTPEVSSVVDNKQKIVAGELNEADVYSIRRVDTQVLIPSGNTLVMGGLVNDSTTKSYTKVPLLGDLPGIGLAFRHESKRRNKSNLLIFITPTIVTDDDYQPTSTDFLKSRMYDLPDEEQSAWDSGKPHDWSRPVY